MWVQLKDALQAIRPCRESQTGWTPAAAMLPGNHSSLALNERGPALKVFWSRRGRDGRRVGERARLPKRARVIKERLTNKPSRRELGRTRPVRSFRFESLSNLVITPTRARSRWLTERIASSSSGSRRSDSCNENAGSSYAGGDRPEELRQNRFEKIGQITFFLVDQGPNG